MTTGIAGIRPFSTRMWNRGCLMVFVTTVTVAGQGCASNTEPTVERSPLRALSPFGIGSCHYRSEYAERMADWIPQMRAIGVGNLRSLNAGWGAVEPVEGEWDWSRLDTQLDYLESQGMQVGGIFGYNSPCNKLDPPGNMPVKNIAGWSRYVTETVKRANGRIKNWEVWNEPPNFTGRDQTAEDYAKIVVAAYDAAKAVDPECQIGIAAKSVHINYLDQAIAAGAKGHFDYVTLHPYEVGGNVIKHPGTESVYLNIVATLRKMLAARDPGNVDCPVIFTELGYAAGGRYNEGGPDTQAHALVKYYTMGIAGDVTCVQWFEGMDGDSGPMGLLDGHGKPRPAYTALAQMIEHLGQHPVYLGWLLLNDTHYAFMFEGARGTVMVTWAATRAADEVSFGGRARIVDPLTGNVTTAASHTLTTAPIIVEGLSDELVHRAWSNKDRPFPWGGDYSDAKSVSVTYGATNAERGLHTQSAKTIAMDAEAYGGGYRHASVAGGNVFMVDPNFLSYTSAPIEISVIARRNRANDKSGFRLIYESTTGYKTGDWYAVPDNKRWHTVTWRIDDAQFVSMWGYNFVLESKGEYGNSYVIKSVTVERLDR